MYNNYASIDLQILQTMSQSMKIQQTHVENSVNKVGIQNGSAGTVSRIRVESE